jgi:hypothetical protein
MVDKYGQNNGGDDEKFNSECVMVAVIFLFPNGELIGENQPVVCCSELVIHKKYCGD